MAKTKWTIDPAHSSVDFAIRHLMVNRVNGAFHRYSAVIESDPGHFITANVAFTIDLESIDTRNKEHAAHLLSPDFFDVEKFPQMMFLANNIVQTDQNRYNVIGEFSLHGITRTETLSVLFKDEAKDSSGKEKAGFQASAQIRLGDYDLTFNEALETGDVLIGDEIHISLDIQLLKEI